MNVVSSIDTKRKLPDGWRWVRIEEVCDVVTGGTPLRINMSFYGGKTPWIKPNDLDRAMFISTSSEYLTEAGVKVSRLLPKGAVLVSCIGNIGKVAIADCPLTTNQQINSLIPSSIVDSIFLYYTCQYFRSEWETASSVALVPILNKSDFASMKISIPTLPEQQRIAKVLKEQMSAVDKARAAAEARLEAVKSLPAAFLRQVFPKQGHPLPFGWRWIKLEKVIKEAQAGFACGKAASNSSSYAFIR